MLKKISIISLSLIMIFLVRCSTIENTEIENTEVKEYEELIEKVNNINIIIDPRIELLSVIMYLSPTYKENVKSIIPQYLTYKEDVERWFGKYKNHEVVELFESMSQKGYSYDAPPASMLYLTKTPHLTIREDIDKKDFNYKQCIRRAGGERKFKKFIQALNSFCEESNFYDFYNSHIDYYQRVIDSTFDTLKNIDYLSQMESYYGSKQNSYNIIFSGMLYGGAYGPRVKGLDGEYDIYSIQGSIDVYNDLPNWGYEKDYKYLVRHEFSHSFINDLTHKNIKEVNKYIKLFEAIEDIMSKQAYVDWETSLNEHLVRAAVIRMTEINEGESAAKNIMATEQSNGFDYIDKIVQLLKDEYEPNRDKYKNFEEFYPEILKLLDKIKNNNL